MHKSRSGIITETSSTPGNDNTVNLDEYRSLESGLAGRYKLIRPVGSGATATVFLATDLRHGRKVALKIALSPATGDQGTRRFLREISVVARLTHPHILPLLDSGEADRHPYYVMPFIEGLSLQERLARDKSLSIDESIRFACEIADALAYAHAAGVVHRDIKPGNVMLSGPHALVADFGASRLVETSIDDPGLTRVGSTIGTPLYMSPEQCEGQPDLDGRSDIYSLGCVLYEMVTGQPPFVGRTTMETIAMRFLKAPPPPHQLRADIPLNFERTLLRSLAVDPTARFATGKEFADALADSVARPGVSTLPGDREAGLSNPSIVVLPFVNLSNDPGDEHFSRGVAEEITDALARIRNLHVVGRSAAGGGRGTTDIRALGERLGVTAVLEGSVRRSGDNVRVSVRLVRTSDGRQLWAESSTHKVSDVFAVQEEIARTVARALEVRLLGQAMAPVTTVAAHPEAHELYLRARHAWSKRTEVQLDRSVEYFMQSIQAEARFARAHAGLADSLVTLALYGLRAPSEVVSAAKASARSALEIDPTLAEAHSALACATAIYDWHWGEAEQGFARSVALDPGYAVAPHWYALNLLAPLGRFDEALAQVAIARRLDPLSASIASGTGMVLYAARRFEESARAYEQALSREPHFFPLHHFMGQSLVQLGQYSDAIGAFERALSLSDTSLDVMASLAHARAISGDRAGAESLLIELEESATRRYVSPYLFAQIHMGLGRPADALSWLERALLEHSAEVMWLGVRPLFDALRGDPGFNHILRATALSPRQ